MKLYMVKLIINLAKFIQESRTHS